MATEYVNPDYTGTSTGSIAQPWKSGADATPINGLELLWKCDSSPDILSGQIELNALSDITFGNYGSGALPRIRCYTALTTSGDWTDIGNDVWTWTAPAGFNLEYAVLGLGSLSERLRDPFKWDRRVNYYGFATGTSGLAAFTEHGQWDTQAGSPAVIAIYSDVNPIDKWGTVYVAGMNTHNVFNVYGASSNILIDSLNFQYGFTPLKNLALTGARNSDIVLQNCLIESMYYGLRLGTYQDNMIYQDNDIYASMDTGIRLGGALEGSGNKILRNTVTDTGHCVDGPGIYGTPMATAGSPLLIAENVVDRCHDGLYWLNEARGIYIDSGQASGFSPEYIDIIGNTVKNLRDSSRNPAYKLNGGTTAVRLISNKSINCNIGFDSSDAYPREFDSFELLFNTFMDVDSAISFTRNSAGNTVDAKVFGNVATANPESPGQATGISLDNDIDDLATAVDNDGNWFYNFGTVITRYQGGTLQHTLGANTVTDKDPLLDNNADLAGNSPARRSSLYSIYSGISNDYRVDAKQRNKLIPYDAGAVGFDTRYKSPIGLRPR